jgi:L-glyceraldehyde 3-phosphate reductase
MSVHRPNPNRYEHVSQDWFRRCGRWGLKLPAISLGCWWNFGAPDKKSADEPEITPTDHQRKLLYTALDNGVTHFDLANNYGPPYGSAEIVVGKIVKDMPRHELVISTKAGWDMWPGPYGDRGSRKYLLSSLEQSLKRLDLDYVDIFYMHRYVSDTPMDEIMGALDTAVKQGKALYAGISSFEPNQTLNAVRECTKNNLAPLLIHQANYSMMNRWIEDGLLEVTQKNGMGVIAFCPLFQGVLSGKYLKGVPIGSRPTFQDSPLRNDEVGENVIPVLLRLEAMARDRGQTMAQFALSWVLRDSRVTSALIGASKPEQIIENVKAAQNTHFTELELDKIDQILSKLTLPKSLWADTDSQ